MFYFDGDTSYQKTWHVNRGEQCKTDLISAAILHYPHFTLLWRISYQLACSDVMFHRQSSHLIMWPGVYAWTFLLSSDDLKAGTYLFRLHCDWQHQASMIVVAFLLHDNHFQPCSLIPNLPKTMLRHLSILDTRQHMHVLKCSVTSMQVFPVALRTFYVKYQQKHEEYSSLLLNHLWMKAASLAQKIINKILFSVIAGDISDTMLGQADEMIA